MMLNRQKWCNLCLFLLTHEENLHSFSAIFCAFSSAGRDVCRQMCASLFLSRFWHVSMCSGLNEWGLQDSVCNQTCLFVLVCLPPQNGRGAQSPAQTPPCQRLQSWPATVSSPGTGQKESLELLPECCLHLSLFVSEFCAYIGNLNRSKSCDEVRDSLAAYLMTQSILFQDVRLDRSKWVCSESNRTVWSLLQTETSALLLWQKTRVCGFGLRNGPSEMSDAGRRKGSGRAPEDRHSQGQKWGKGAEKSRPAWQER